MSRGEWRCPRGHKPRVETERLLLRPWGDDDVSEAFALIDTHRDALRPTMPWVDAHRDAGACAASIRRYTQCHADERPDELVYGVFQRGSGEAVGGVGLHSFRCETGQAQLGYWIVPPAEGQGYAGEAARALIDHAFTPGDSGGLGLRRIEVRCGAANAGSRRVAEQIGLRHEATLAQERPLPGADDRWDDTLIFAALSDDWAELANG